MDLDKSQFFENAISQIATMTETNATILETVRRIEDNQAGMDRDMEKDRQNLQDLNIRLGAVEAELSQLRKAINQSSERTRDKLVEASVPIIQATDKLTGQIKKSKMVMLKKETKSWWERFLGR